jgi:predicted transcriptional regulator
MNVQLDDRLYQQAKQRAAEAGFASVDEYVADVVSHDLIEDLDAEQPDLQHLFTPERLAEIDAGFAEIQAGKCFTAEEVREHFKQKRAEWDRKNGKR